MIGVKEPIPGVVYPAPDRLRAYVAAGELPQLTLIEALCRSFEMNAGRVALSTPEGDVRYAELDDITNRYGAALIRMGLQPLERVLFQVGNCKELIYAVIGCLKAGVIPVCTLPAHREKEIEYLGCHTDAQAHIVQGDDAKFDLEAFALKMRQRVPTVHHVLSVCGQPREGVLRLEDLAAAEDCADARACVAAVSRDPFQVAIFQLSGGTTSVPKVIPRMQNDYLLNATRTAECLGFRNTDVMFMPMPMMHNASMICFWLPTLLSGAAFALPADMTPESWGKVFRDKRPTVLGVIRPLLPRLDAMVDQKLATLDSVRVCWSPDGARLMREKYGILTQAMFGMTEGLNMYCRADDPEQARDWTVGYPLSPFDEVRLVVPGTNDEAPPGEIGELTCRGPYTLSGYYNAPVRNSEAFTPDGFYKAGDLLSRREINGRIYYAFAGRTKDVVDRGSEKVNCEEVENAVSTHEAIGSCAIVGMPDPVLGERICAYVVLRQGRNAPGVEQLGRHLKNLGMAKFKWPERIELIEALPLTKVGKLDKAALRQDISTKLEQERAGSTAAQG